MHIFGSTRPRVFVILGRVNRSQTWPPINVTFYREFVRELKTELAPINTIFRQEFEREWKIDLAP